MKNKNILMILIVLGILVILFLVTKAFYQGGDGWIRDSDGLWIEHGSPKTIPPEVREQYDAILCGFLFYAKAKETNVTLNSQCLGRCKDYVVDIVNVPRTLDDDKEENQCRDYLSGNVTKFIEIDKDANIVRIVD